MYIFHLSKFIKTKDINKGVPTADSSSIFLEYIFLANPKSAIFIIPFDIRIFAGFISLYNLRFTYE